MSKKPISQKIDLARTHMDVLVDDALRERFGEVLDLAEQTYQVRNDVMHGAWQIDPVEKRQVAINYAKPDGGQRFLVDVEKAAADADGALRGLLQVFVDKAGFDVAIDMIPFYSQPPPWAKTP